MRKHRWIVVVLIVAAVAWAGLRAAGVGQSATGVVAVSIVPEAQELVVGTLKLEGTDEAVSAAQAAELLPLWKAYRSLRADDATAPAELVALLAQIKGEMTAAQLEAVDDMQLTAADLAAFMQDQGIQTASAGASASSAASATQAAGRPRPGRRDGRSGRRTAGRGYA
ncbi:MAG: hypothetical protein V1772_14450 [Chloroflexota bacterium]